MPSLIPIIEPTTPQSFEERLHAVLVQFQGRAISPRTLIEIRAIVSTLLLQELEIRRQKGEIRRHPPDENLIQVLFDERIGALTIELTAAGRAALSDELTPEEKYQEWLLKHGEELHALARELKGSEDDESQ